MNNNYIWSNLMYRWHVVFQMCQKIFMQNNNTCPVYIEIGQRMTLNELEIRQAYIIKTRYIT